jgi:hypothetical protein
VSLNIGGTVITTSEQTLQADRASILAALAADEKILQQNQGSLFLDGNPKHYNEITPETIATWTPTSYHETQRIFVIS